MSGGRRTPYTDEQDKLILGCPYGSLQDLSSGMGRSYKALCARRNVLTQGRKMERVHKGLKPRPRRVKICFWVEDLDTNERLSLDGMDTMQVELVFDTSEIEVKVAEAK